jgi:hypothetical protein
MTTYFRDPTLVELLSDPLTHAVMQADHVNPQELENLLRDLARRRANSLVNASSASGSASVDHVRRYNELLFEPAERTGKEIS